MRILLALYYYRPYISGLTIYVERLAGALARRGHAVTVLTSRYDASLPAEEWADGVRVVRVPVALRIGKGVVMPSLGRAAAALLREHDVLSVHLPNVDAPGLTLRAHRQRMLVPRPEDVAAFRAAHGAGGGPLIAFVARLAAEKGVEVLVDALPGLLERFPGTKVVFAGPYEDVLGERAYRERLRGPIAALGAHWEFLGPVAQRDLPALYGAAGAVVVPSLNATEGFSLVQVEGMLCGTPAVVSDLPGVRQPVRLTGMGEVAPPGSLRRDRPPHAAGRRHAILRSGRPAGPADNRIARGSEPRNVVPRKRPLTLGVATGRGALGWCALLSSRPSTL